jgi:hypothetical protein
MQKTMNAPAAAAIAVRMRSPPRSGIASVI